MIRMNPCNVARTCGFRRIGGGAVQRPAFTLTNGSNADATQVMANFTYLQNCLTNLPTAHTGRAAGPLDSGLGHAGDDFQPGRQDHHYYTPYNGNQMPIYTEPSWFDGFLGAANITTASVTGNAGPAVVAANSNYDLFAWSTSGTVTLTRGPAWTSDTARGTGAGTTELPAHQTASGQQERHHQRRLSISGPTSEPCGRMPVRRSTSRLAASH